MSAPPPGDWPFLRDLLVVDDDRHIIDWVAAQFADAPQNCFTAASHADGLRVLLANPSVEYVVLDHGAAGADLGAAVRAIRAARPDVVLVGSSGRTSRAEFAALGVSRYLQKPWRFEELVATLPRRVGNCIDCQLPLPLRHAGAGETALPWQCAGCGARYRGLLDEDADEDARRNVRPA